VRERLVAGDSDDQVLTYLTQRYGDFVLLKPPIKPATMLLWFGPFAVLLVGAGLIVAFYRGRGRSAAAAAAAPTALDAVERARLQRLLGEDQEPRRS
jgi:cytochrome c-type biogenesis protein CcmH